MREYRQSPADCAGGMGEYMEICCIRLGMVGTNCYLLVKEETKETIIIDPADQAGVIAGRIGRDGLKPAAIYLTHGHFDHIMAAAELAARYRIRITAHEAETALLGDAGLNASGSMGGCPVTLKPDREVRDGEKLTDAGFSCQVIHTPGHTAGGVCYWFEENRVLVSGDTLFLEGIGRSDLPTGNGRKLVESIRERLFVLPEDTAVLPGHGGTTTIGYEKKNNAYVNGDMPWFD